MLYQHSNSTAESSHMERNPKEYLLHLIHKHSLPIKEAAKIVKISFELAEFILKEHYSQFENISEDSVVEQDFINGFADRSIDEGQDTLEVPEVELDDGFCQCDSCRHAQAIMDKPMSEEDYDDRYDLTPYFMASLSLKSERGRTQLNAPDC